MQGIEKTKPDIDVCGIKINLINHFMLLPFC